MGPPFVSDTDNSIIHHDWDELTIGDPDATMNVQQKQQRGMANATPVGYA